VRAYTDQQLIEWIETFVDDVEQHIPSDVSRRIVINPTLVRNRLNGDKLIQPKYANVSNEALLKYSYLDKDGRLPDFLEWSVLIWRNRDSKKYPNARWLPLVGPRRREKIIDAVRVYLDSIAVG